MIEWERIKWVIQQIKEMKMKSAPFATLGIKLMLGSVTLFSVSGIAFHIFLPERFFINELEFTNGDISIYSLIIGGFFIAVGFLMIIFEMYNYKKARKTAKLIIQGMKDGYKNFPINILSYEDKNNSRDTIKVGMLESDDNLDKQIDYYNSEKQIDLFNRFILNDEVDKLYICARARIPFLVAYGYCLKGNVNIKYIETKHNTSDSCFLNDVNNNIDIIKNNNVVSSNSGDIGLAISFTSEIQKNHLPSNLQEHTQFVSSSNGTGRLLISNQDNLREVVNKIVSIIDDLSLRVEGTQRIHLFLSVQTSFAIELGRNFQEGMHKNWIIYNFNGTEGKYTWALKLEKEKISRYIFCN